MLNIRSLTCGYDEKMILHEINLTLMPGTDPGGDRTQRGGEIHHGEGNQRGDPDRAGVDQME